MESLLKVLVQDIEETVCETPHEEEDGDKRNLFKSVTFVSNLTSLPTGMMDCLVVISPAPVTAWSSTLFLCVALSMTSTADGRRSVLLSAHEELLLPKLNLPIVCSGRLDQRRRGANQNNR